MASSHPDATVAAAQDARDEIRDNIISALVAFGFPEAVLDRRMTHEMLSEWRCGDWLTAESAVHDALVAYHAGL